MIASLCSVIPTQLMVDNPLLMLSKMYDINNHVKIFVVYFTQVNFEHPKVLTLCLHTENKQGLFDKLNPAEQTI